MSLIVNDYRMLVGLFLVTALKRRQSSRIGGAYGWAVAQNNDGCRLLSRSGWPWRLRVDVDANRDGPALHCDRRRLCKGGRESDGIDIGTRCRHQKNGRDRAGTGGSAGNGETTQGRKRPSSTRPFRKGRLQSGRQVA